MGTVLKYVCIFERREKKEGRKEEKCIFMLHMAKKMGLV